jgi:hypothetical protein
MYHKASLYARNSAHNSRLDAAPKKKPRIEVLVLRNVKEMFKAL